MAAPLQTAMKLAMNLELLDSRKILADTLARGGRMVAACGNPRIVLGVFSKMLPSVQGVSQEVHEADCAELRKAHALTKNHFTSPAVTGFASQGAVIGGRAAPAGIAARRKQAPPSIAGARHGTVLPAAHAHAAAAGARPPPHARGSGPPGHYGPQLARTGAGRGRGGGGVGGGNGGAGAATLSPADIASIRAKRAAEHLAVQTQQASTLGNPQSGDVPELPRRGTRPLSLTPNVRMASVHVVQASWPPAGSVHRRFRTGGVKRQRLEAVERRA